VFFDPSAGFVTGGGYIMQAPTMSPADLPIGKNNFGFIAKYNKKSGVPEGELEFQCKVCGMNFHGSNYKWLVVKTLVDGRKYAQAEGTGTLNGVGGYGFLVTVIDGDKKPDTFMIRIWDSSGSTVYDSEPATNDTALPTVLAEGGSIVIHTK
jgi:hypothetical protein